jgi:CheY-like chemotaxis protein
MPMFALGGTTNRSILLPRRGDWGKSAPEAGARRTLVRRDGTPIRCLIVEDEWIIAFALQDMLEALGATVVGTAATGTRAIHLVERHWPDIVLMDISIPGGMDGIETARAIIDRFGVPVVFISALGDEDMRARIAALNGPELVLKPASDSALEAAIRRACRLP